jgi:hypothetical protein
VVTQRDFVAPSCQPPGIPAGASTGCQLSLESDA